jgi:hypothetical protein
LAGAVDPLELVGIGLVGGQDVEIEVARHHHHVGGLDQSRQQIALGGAFGHPLLQRGIELAQRQLRADAGGDVDLQPVPDQRAVRLVAGADRIRHHRSSPSARRKRTCTSNGLR